MLQHLERQHAVLSWYAWNPKQDALSLLPNRFFVVQATRDFAVEAAQLSEALAQKEEEVQMTGQHTLLPIPCLGNVPCTRQGPVRGLPS